MFRSLATNCMCNFTMEYFSVALNEGWTVDDVGKFLTPKKLGIPCLHLLTCFFVYTEVVY